MLWYVMLKVIVVRSDGMRQVMACERVCVCACTCVGHGGCHGLSHGITLGVKVVRAVGAVAWVEWMVFGGVEKLKVILKKERRFPMGNRAVVTFANMADVEQYLAKDSVDDGRGVSGFVGANPHKVGVYLHWNGGKDSITAFCEACRQLGFRGPVSDCYGVARFVQVVANFFGGTDGLSVGVDTLEHLDCDNYDNGVYIVNDDWEIIGREFRGDGEQEDHDVEGMVKELVAKQRGIK